MRQYTLEELDKLKKEYLSTLNDFEEDVLYITDKSNAQFELTRFINWLKDEKDPTPKQLKEILKLTENLTKEELKQLKNLIQSKNKII